MRAGWIRYIKINLNFSKSQTIKHWQKKIFADSHTNIYINEPHPSAEIIYQGSSNFTVRGPQCKLYKKSRARKTKDKWMNTVYLILFLAPLWYDSEHKRKKFHKTKFTLLVRVPFTSGSPPIRAHLRTGPPWEPPLHQIPPGSHISCIYIRVSIRNPLTSDSTRILSYISHL